MDVVTRRRVLVVDDEQVIADTLAKILDLNGYEASAVYTGTAAVESARSLQPDLIISDVIMPDMDGIQAAISIRGFLPNCVEVGRIRQSGAGRKPVEKKTPEVIEAIEILLEHDTAGDPITGIRWTHKTPAGIAELLRQLDIEISANTVARLLYDMDFSLRVNRKAIATDSSRDRDQQFRYISSLRTRFERQGLPIISVDTKKRELVGNFKNNGVKWDRTPVRGTTWFGEPAADRPASACTTDPSTAAAANTVMVSNGRLRRTSSRPPSSGPVRQPCASRTAGPARRSGPQPFRPPRRPQQPARQPAGADPTSWHRVRTVCPDPGPWNPR